jgi:hypothetical protein
MARKPRTERLETAQERLERLKAEIAQAEQDAITEAQEMARKGPRGVALTTALKEVIFAIRDEYPQLAPEWMTAIPQQAFPREALVAKRFGLSETERHSASEKGRKAIGGL